MFTLIFLLVSFAILGILDIIGMAKINTSTILVFSLITIFLFLYTINFNPVGYFQNLGILALVEIFGSIIILFIYPYLGMGDKIFLSTTFLLYPFWIIWAIIILAIILTKPLFALIRVFIKNADLALPFYPFLFLASFIVYLLLKFI